MSALDLARWQFGITTVLAYQAWTYWVFRHRISRSANPDTHGLPAAHR